MSVDISDRLYTESTLISELSDNDVNRMFEIMTHTYSGLNRDQFQIDLFRKDVVLVLRTGQRVIEGFTTIKTYETIFEDSKVGIIYSGDTIIEPEYRCKNDLFREWMRFALSKKDELNDTPLYWFLLSAGEKTYRIMTTFFRTYYPSIDDVSSTQFNYLQRLSNHVAFEMFSDDFNPLTGVVRFSNGNYSLNDDNSIVTESMMRNKYIRFFTEKNPLFTQGDELVCMSEISEENIVPRARKFLLG